MNIFINKVIFIIILVVILSFLLWVGLRLFIMLLPFMIAYLLSKPLNKLVMGLHKRIKLPLSFLSFFVVIGFIGILLSFISFLVFKGVQSTSHLSYQAIAITQTIQTFADNINKIVINVPWSAENIVLTDVFIQFYDILFESISDVINKLIAFAISIVRTIPNIGLFVFFIFLSLYFFTKDRELISSRISTWIEKIETPLSHKIKTHAFATMKSYFKALLTLVSITFSISLVSLTILGIPFSFFIAFAIAIVDFIPVIGPATIYIPWVIFMVLISEYSMAIALTVVYVITTLTRQVLEPKIISSKIGANPLVTIIAMYVSYRLIGVLGFIVGPILVMIVLIVKKGYESAIEKDEH